MGSPVEDSSRERNPPGSIGPSISRRVMVLKFPAVILLLCLPRLSWARPTWHSPTCYPDLLSAGAEELVAGLESGAWSSAYILRIHEVNDLLHVVTEINPDALTIAEALDAERANGTTRSALHGIPMLIKNNIATKDRMNNTAGSFALLGAAVPRDATVAGKLRAAGVILLGKSNLSQWANFRSSNSSSGWSADGNQTTSAYHPNADPSGSSSGSGVGTSIGLAFASLGTETDGSILSPSSANNLVGIKPSVGLTSRSLVIPISSHQDTVGPMARSVSDAARILSIIAGRDPADNYTSAQPWNSPPDYSGSLNFSSFRGARIGVPRQVLTSYADGTSPPLVAAFDAALRVIEQAGATIVEDANFPAWQGYLRDDNETVVLQADFISDLASYLSRLTSNPRNVTSLDDISDFTRGFPPEAYPERDTASWDEALSRGWNNSDPRFWPAYQASYYYGAEGGVLGALEKYNLDALVLPTDYAPGLPARAGLPVVTVPMGSYPANTTVVRSQNWGLVQVGPNIPFGISFMGAKWSEESLIGYAYAFEQRTNFRSRTRPYLTPSTQLADVVNG
ncbi:amidase [Diplocarpon mali]|nr:amidase [Diplocarpon mali]